MTRNMRPLRLNIGVAFIVVFLTAAGVRGADWLQWGGPQRNFVTDSKGLAAWPDGGPKKLWSRALGEGHSSILVDGARLYTMYRPIGLLSMVRRSQQETIIAMEAGTGKTAWEHTFGSATSGLDLEYGAGPHSTPLIVGTRLFAVGSIGQLFALDKASGKVLWSHDLVGELKGLKFGRGYSPSPIAYKSTVIVPVGHAGQALMAFDQASGKVVWKNGDYDIAPASPILIMVDGQEQMVVFGGNEVVGVNPNNGAVLWSHPHKTDWGLNISTPVWGPDNLLFISSAYGTGSRVLQLSQAAGKTTAKELWFTNRMRVHIGSTLRIGDQIIGSSGDFGPAFITAVDVKTGRQAWQDRAFARAQLVRADDKIVVLDEDGSLGLVTVSPTGLKILSRATVLTNIAWTPPTLAGTRVYLRDRKTIVALDLGA